MAGFNALYRATCWVSPVFTCKILLDGVEVSLRGWSKHPLPCRTECAYRASTRITKQWIRATSVGAEESEQIRGHNNICIDVNRTDSLSGQSIGGKCNSLLVGFRPIHVPTS